MLTAVRKPCVVDTYISDRVFDGIRARDADASARDRSRAKEVLDRAKRRV